MTTAELIEKLERADGPSRELDWAISDALFGQRLDADIPAYTASIDAAMMMLPADHKHWNVGGSPTQGFAGLGLYGACVNDEAYGESRHPAIALCIAALKAKRTERRVKRLTSGVIYIIPNQSPYATT